MHNWIITFLALGVVGIRLWAPFGLVRWQLRLGREVPSLRRHGVLGEAEILAYEYDEYHWVTYPFTPRGRTKTVLKKKVIGGNARQRKIGSRV